jgi:hypothetical protein
MRVFHNTSSPTHDHLARGELIAWTLARANIGSAGKVSFPATVAVKRHACQSEFRRKPGWPEQ